MPRALQSTMTVASASTRPARGPKRAAPASAPTALKEIAPSSTSRARAWPPPTSATTTSSPMRSVLVPSSRPTIPAPTPSALTSVIRAPSLNDSEKNRGSRVECGLGLAALRHRLVVHDQVDLVVEGEGSAVQIRAADRRPAAVDDHGLGVEQRGPVCIDL